MADVSKSILQTLGPLGEVVVDTVVVAADTVVAAVDMVVEATVEVVAGVVVDTVVADTVVVVVVMGAGDQRLLIHNANPCVPISH